MTLRPFAAALLLMLAPACVPSPAGEETNQGQIVQNRVDGFLLHQQHVQLVNRFRPPMDHGSGVQADRISFRLWQARFDGDDARLSTHPVDFVWHRGWFGIGDEDVLQNPAFLALGNQFVVNGCRDGGMREATLHGTRCIAPTETPRLVQIGGRMEQLTLAGTRLTFAAGLDGRRRPCTLDLRQIATETAPIVSSDPRFVVSYLPPDTAYVVDRAEAARPIFQASCAGFRAVGAVTPVAMSVTATGPRRHFMNIAILDMVPDPDRTMPALFVAVPDGEAGYRLNVLREGRAPQIVVQECHDCLPPVGGFFRSDPNWLLLDAGLSPGNGTMTISATLFDLANNRELSQSWQVRDRERWPAP